MPGGNGRPQKGMNRRNHNDGFGQSGQQKYGNSGQTRKPKYTPPRNSGPSIGEILFGTPKGGRKKRR